LFIERQDEIAALGGDEEIRVLDTLGNALAGQHFANVVKGDKGPQLVIGDIGINGHRFIAASYHLQSAPGRLVCLAPLAYSSRRGEPPPRVVTLARAEAREKAWTLRYPRKKSPMASISRPGNGICGVHAGAAPRSPSATARIRAPD